MLHTKPNEGPVFKGRLAPLSYLAVPYTYKTPDQRVAEMVQRFRFETATKAMGWLINTYGWNVFSPITHSHPVHVMCPDVRGDWEFWKKIDTEYLQISQRIITLTLPGWTKSTGVTAENQIALALGLEVYFLHPTPGGEFIITETPSASPYRVSVDLV